MPDGFRPPRSSGRSSGRSPECSAEWSPERLRDQATAALLPFFVDGPSCDVKAARLAVEGMLDGYNAATPKELQLSTQITALGWAAMACLRTAMAAKNLSTEDVLRLQDSAIALDRSSQKATKALAACRKERARNPKAVMPENWRWDEAAFQLVISQALAKLTDANTRLTAYMATLTLVEPMRKLPFLFAEPMTASVLARRTLN